MNDVSRVLVLTSDTGAGHRSVSNALIEAARGRPEYGLEFVDVDPYLPLPALPGSAAPAEPPTIFDGIARLYGPMIVKAPWLWGVTWYGTNNDLALQGYLTTLGEIVVGRVMRAVQRIDAQAVVSVHPLANHAMVRARARLRRPDLPLLTVVTDLVDVHRWWAAPEVDQYIVGSDASAAGLRRYGVPPSRISALGIPLRREFYAARLSAREAREQLGMDVDRPLVLLMSGGAGAGRIRQTARAIAAIGATSATGATSAGQSALRFQFVVLTGHNQRAQAELEREAWPVPTTVRGIVPNIAELITAADVIVTKPGSLTVAESLAMGRPLVLDRPLPGQEEGNVAYVVKAGAGLHYRSPQEAAEAVGYLLRDPAARWEMSQRAMRLAKPRATERTLDTLRGLLLRAESHASASILM